MIPLKNLIIAIITAMAPILFSLISGRWPDFPLTLDSFVSLVVWLVSIFISGWNSRQSYGLIRSYMASSHYRVRS